MDKADKLGVQQSTRRPFKSRDLAFSREVNRQGQRNWAIHAILGDVAVFGLYSPSTCFRSYQT